MADFRFTITGHLEVNATLAAFGDRYLQALAVGLREWDEERMTESKELCPVDTGALRSTGHAEDVVREGDVLTGVLSYGGVAGSGTDVGYAVYVHENLEAHHPVGQAKFLEQPVREAEPHFVTDLAESVRAQLGL